MQRVALVAFSGTVAHKVMDLCEGFDRFEVGSGHVAIPKFVSSGVLDGYEKIIAMGLQKRSRAKFVSVEKICWYDGKELALDYELEDGDLFVASKIAARFEKTFCNMLASELRLRYPGKIVTFLHIPPKADKVLVASRLSSSAA